MSEDFLKFRWEDDLHRNGNMEVFEQTYRETKKDIAGLSREEVIKQFGNWLDCGGPVEASNGGDITALFEFLNNGGSKK